MGTIKFCFKVKTKNPAGGMDVCVLCLLYSKDRRQKSQHNQDKEVRTKYKERTKIYPGGSKIFRIRPDRPWGFPAPYTKGTGSVQGGNPAGAWH